MQVEIKLTFFSPKTAMSQDKKLFISPFSGKQVSVVSLPTGGGLSYYMRFHAAKIIPKQEINTFSIAFYPANKS
ncbi:MAG: hypothetical protein NVSMB70_09720 [Chamaesiphon sp.]